MKPHGRTLKSIHNDFLNGLQSSVKPYEKHELEVMEAFLADVKRYQKENNTNTYPRVSSVYGEWEGADGFIEKVIETEDGKFFKLWGNDFLFRAVPDVSVIKSLDLAKSLISEVPRDLIGKNPVLRLAFAYEAIFAKKRFIKFLDQLIEVINVRIVDRIIIPENEWHRVSKEIRDCALSVLKDDDFGRMMAKWVKFITFFIEIDTAYCFRIQDAFGNVESRGIGAFWEGLDILISRETHKGIPQKWKFIKKGMNFMLWRYPEMKQFLDDFFNELDYERIKMDENEIYFTLTYVSYDFRGLSKEVRFAERERIDKEHRHVFLKK